jgi:hypothetical protein
MKISVIPIQISENGITESSHNILLQPEVVMLKVSGDADSSNNVFKKARMLIEKNGTKDMVESFDWAVQNNAFFNEE